MSIIVNQIQGTLTVSGSKGTEKDALGAGLGVLD